MELQILEKEQVPEGPQPDSYMLAALAPSCFDIYKDIAEHILQGTPRDASAVPHVTLCPPTTADFSRELDPRAVEQEAINLTKFLGHDLDGVAAMCDSILSKEYDGYITGIIIKKDNIHWL